MYFHARVASEAEDGFTIDDVAAGIVDKLVHRHPHVFAGLDVADADEVERNWDALKAQEKGRASVLDGHAAGAARAGARRQGARPGRQGRRDPGPSSVHGDAGRPDLGDRLLGLVVEARAEGRDAEQELRDAVRRLSDLVRSTEPDSP